MNELAILQILLDLVQRLAGDTSDHARETTRYRILNQVELNGAILENSTYGLAELYAYIQDAIIAINAVRLDTQEPHLATLTDVLEAIALLTPVTLPETPPPGYGGGAEPSDVWLYVIDVPQMCSLD